MPCRATGEAPGSGQEAKAGMKGKPGPQPLLCFWWEEAHMAEALGIKTKPVSRRARFKSVVTLIVNGEKKIFEGTLEGVIAREKSGNGGFGYDPIFIADEYPGLTLADITEEQKNDISHRGKALRAMAAWLHENL